MNEVTQILNAIEQGDPQAAAELLPLVYDELRKLAAQKMAQEKPGQTLEATALVHEAYVRLVGADEVQQWDGRGHFFAAAAEAMRRILVDNARRKKAHIHGGDRQHFELAEYDLVTKASPERLVALDDVLSKLEREHPRAAEVAKLKIFAGFSVEEAGGALAMSRATAYRNWTYARAWLRAELKDKKHFDNSGNR